MPKVYNIGPKYFAQLAPYPIPWRKERACIGWTQEIDGDYRYGKSLVINIPGKHAFVFGWWQGTRDEETALRNALMTRDMTEEDMTEEVADNFARRAYVQEV